MRRQPVTAVLQLALVACIVPTLTEASRRRGSRPCTGKELFGKGRQSACKEVQFNMAIEAAIQAALQDVPAQREQAIHSAVAEYNMSVATTMQDMQGQIEHLQVQLRDGLAGLQEQTTFLTLLEGHDMHQLLTRDAHAILKFNSDPQRNLNNYLTCVLEDGANHGFSKNFSFTSDMLLKSEARGYEFPYFSFLKLPLRELALPPNSLRFEAMLSDILNCSAVCGGLVGCATSVKLERFAYDKVLIDVSGDDMFINSRNMEVVDVDGDGTPEIALMSPARYNGPKWYNGYMKLFALRQHRFSVGAEDITHRILDPRNDDGSRSIKNWHWVDVNGDGHVDIVTTGAREFYLEQYNGSVVDPRNNVEMYLNNGSGFFEVTELTGSFLESEVLIPHCYDADLGDEVSIKTCAFANRWRNNGAGKTGIFQLSNTPGLRSADFDGFANYSFLDGVDPPFESYAKTGKEHQALTSGDINKDGTNDLVATGWGGHEGIHVVVGKRGGGFDAVHRVDCPNVGDFGDVKVVDLDGAYMKDMVVTDRDSGKLYAVYSTSYGEFNFICVALPTTDPALDVRYVTGKGAGHWARSQSNILVTQTWAGTGQYTPDVFFSVGGQIMQYRQMSRFGGAENAMWTSRVVPTGMQNENIHSIHEGDINGDGMNDLVFSLRFEGVRWINGHDLLADDPTAFLLPGDDDDVW